MFDWNFFWDCSCGDPCWTSVEITKPDKGQLFSRLYYFADCCDLDSQIDCVFIFYSEILLVELP